MNKTYIIIFALLCGGAWAEERQAKISMSLVRHIKETEYQRGLADGLAARSSSQPIKVTLEHVEENAKPCVRERSYTVKEIDDLRSAINTRWIYGTSYTPPLTKEQLAEQDAMWKIINAGESVSMPCSFSRSYDDKQKIREVEELTRTAMLAGFTAEDIRAEDKRAYEESNPPRSQ